MMMRWVLGLLMGMAALTAVIGCQSGGDTNADRARNAATERAANRHIYVQHNDSGISKLQPTTGDHRRSDRHPVVHDRIPVPREPDDHGSDRGQAHERRQAAVLDVADI